MTRSANSAPVTILILDANQRAALAATRSLGRAGYRVLVADEHPRSLSGASRFATGEFQYPSPYREPQRFLDWFGDTHCSLGIQVVLPITEVTTDLLTRHRHEWPGVKIPFASTEKIDRISDKVQLYHHAIDLGVPVPQSVVVESPADLDLAISKIGFPAFLKPRRSRLWLNGGFISTSVQKVESKADVAEVCSLPEFSLEPYLYQRPAYGNGRGIFALFHHGEPVTFFCHRRIREKPPEGGVSVLSESCEVDPALRDHAQRILHSVNWHGVAMVEFKGDGIDAQLMEINARFWGSLQLAIDAGIDFPALLIDAALRGEPPSAPTSYRNDVRLRWLLGDLDRLYLTFKRQLPLAYKARAAFDFVRPDLLRTRHEVFRWHDPRPAWREAMQYITA